MTNRAFFAGEEVRVIATSELHSQKGGALIPYQWQFTVGPVASRCVGGFSRAAIALTRIRGDVAWGDYDQDGDLDILLIGDSGGYVTEVWRNDGGSIFNQISTTLPGITGGAAWGDYDNDGDLDILLAGWTGGESIAEIWRNDGRDVFNRISTTLPGVSGQVAWGDYDNDGDLDILLSGLSHTNGNSLVTEVWRNDGRDIFTRVPIPLPGVSWSNIAWGDYDNDGDLDILLNGTPRLIYADSTKNPDAVFDGDLNLLAEPEFPGFLLTFDPKTHYLYSSDEKGNLFVIAPGSQRE